MVKRYAKRRETDCLDDGDAYGCEEINEQVWLTKAFIGIVGGGACPRTVIIEREAFLAVAAGSVVLAAANQVAAILRRTWHALGGVAVALAPVREIGKFWEMENPHYSETPFHQELATNHMLIFQSEP